MKYEARPGELLSDHLAAVGRIAASLAAKFGAGDIARAAGNLHDLGKYNPEFQAQLKEEQP